MKIVRPTLVLNKTVCQQNIELMVEKAKRHHLRFRPHFKTHQSLEIGHWFRNLGVKHITVSSVSMAAFFAKDGWNDITIAMPFNIHETEGLNELLTDNNINIIVDNTLTIEHLKEKLTGEIGLFIKISTGYNRSGISSISHNRIDSILEAAEKNKKISFKGFITHSGHTYSAGSRNEVQNIQFDTLQKMDQLKKTYLKRYPNLEISIGDTPSCSITENFRGVDEIRPGNFVFYDLVQHSIGACNIDDIAVRMHCPVVSKQPARNEIIVYGGAIHFSKDWLQNIDGKPLYGRIIITHNNERILLGPLSCLISLSQEHGILKVTSKEFKQINMGDIVEIIPVHSCLTAQSMGKYLTTKGEEIEMMKCY